MNRPLLIQLNRRRAPLHRVAESARLALTDIEAQLNVLSSRSQKGTVLPSIEELLGMMDRLLKTEHASEEHTRCAEKARTACSEAAELFRVVDVQRFDTKKAVQRLFGIGRALDQAKDLNFLVSDDDAGMPRQDLPEPRELHVAIGEPRLHFPDRDPARISFDAEVEMERGPVPMAVESPLASPSVFDEPEGEVADARFDEEIPADKRLEVLTEDGRRKEQDPTFASGPDGERAKLKQLIRDCLDEINACANLRRLAPDEVFDWAAMRGFEQRMLSALDALLSYGIPFFSSNGDAKPQRAADIVAETIAYAEDALTVDPGRAFATAFVLSSIAGADCARAAVALLKRSHPDTHQAQARALSLVDNPDVTQALREMLSGEEPAFIGVALDALYAAGKLSLVDVAPLTEHSNHHLRLKAIRAMGVCAEREAASTLLKELVETDLDDEVVYAAVEALVGQGERTVLQHARERLEEELEAPNTLTQQSRQRFVELLAVAGDIEDHDLIKAHYELSADAARALGFYGDARHVDLLIHDLAPLEEDAVRFTSPRERREIARALIRITGAPLVDDSPTAGRYSPSINHVRWSAWWDEHKANFEEQGRYRFGDRYAPSLTVAELLASDVPANIRSVCAAELALACSGRPIMLHTFATMQLRELQRSQTILKELQQAES